MGNLIRRGSVFYVEFYQSGRRIRRSLNTSEKSVARIRMAAIERQLAAGKYQTEILNPHVTEFLSEFLVWARQHKTLNTIKKDEMWWRHLIKFCKPVRVGDVTQNDIERFKADRLNRGLKASSVNNALRHIKAIYNRGSKLQLLNVPNPVLGVQLLPTEKNHPKFLNTREVEILLEEARGYNRDILFFVSLGLYAGLRRIEIANARWEWIDWDRKLIHVQASETFSLKNHEARTIPLNAKLRGVLKASSQDCGYIIHPEKQPGQHVYRVEMRKALTDVLSGVGLEWVTAHVLRHTFASRLAQENVSLYKISKWLGHKDLQTTQIYAHLQNYDEAIDLI